MSRVGASFGGVLGAVAGGTAGVYFGNQIGMKEAEEKFGPRTQHQSTWDVYALETGQYVGVIGAALGAAIGAAIGAGSSKPKQVAGVSGVGALPSSMGEGFFP